MSEKSKQAPGYGQDYHIGYGQPPKEHQFKKGRSGNPKGRPRGAKGLKTILSEQMHGKMTIKMDGQTQTVSKLTVIIINLSRKAMQGDLRAANTLLDLVQKHLPQEMGPDPDAPVTDDDQHIVESFRQRIVRQISGTGEDQEEGLDAMDQGRSHGNETGGAAE